VARTDFGAVVVAAFGPAAFVDGPDALIVFGPTGLATVVFGPFGVLRGFAASTGVVFGPFGVFGGFASTGTTESVNKAETAVSQMVVRCMREASWSARGRNGRTRLAWLV
jgi:hypothetical protein